MHIPASKVSDDRIGVKLPLRRAPCASYNGQTSPQDFTNDGGEPALGPDRTYVIRVRDPDAERPRRPARRDLGREPVHAGNGANRVPIPGSSLP